jgi:sialic acid synthase SpsE
MPMKPVIIDNTPIGDGHPTVFLAEIGSSFDHDMDQAKKMIQAASQAKADFLKGEILLNENFSLDDAYKFSYLHGDGQQKAEESHREIVKRKCNPKSFYEQVFQQAKDLDMAFILSVYDLESVWFAKDLGASAIKIAASNINHLPLIKAACETGLPLIFDLGNTYWDEIGRAVAWCRDFKAKGLILQHHPGSGPAQAAQHHLNIIDTYKRAFDVPVGLTCHYIGDEILYAAVGAGANTLEKPISFTPEKQDIDTVFAVQIQDLPDVVQKTKNAWQAMGSPVPRINPDRDLRQRMGLVADKDLAKGDRVDLTTMRFALPCQGISVEDWEKVLNKPVARDIPEGRPLSWEDIIF